jgi:hypothetical protein
MKPVDFVTDNGINFKILWEGHKAKVFCNTEDNSEWFVSKEDLEQMSFSAKIKGVTHVTLFTDMGLELHSTERKKDVGFDRIKRVLSV